MYVVVVYDVNEKRLSAVEKYLKRYLQHTQLSVFEGEISRTLLNEVLKGIEELIDPETDSVRIYVFEGRPHIKIERIGRSRYPEPDSVI